MRYVPLTLLVLSFTLPAAAQPVEDADWGVRFTPPAGWQPLQAPGGYLFVGPDQQSVLLMLPHETRTLDALRQEALQGFQDDAGTLLRITGAPTPFGDTGLAADYAGWLEGAPVHARIVALLAPHGRGASIMVATAPDRYTEALGLVAEAVAEGLIFIAPSTVSSTAPAPGPVDAAWDDALRGCRLYRNKSYDSGDATGYIHETVIVLCDGYFNYRDNSFTTFKHDVPGYADRNRRGGGDWRVVRQGNDAVLHLGFHDGSIRTYTLGRDGSKTFLDGARWLRVCNPNSPVQEARPQCD